MDENELVHWCHGATGAIQLLIAAYVILRDNKYLSVRRRKHVISYNVYCFQAAKRCADLIWHKGVLRKGPGICHGVSGNGYAFLLLYRLTHEQEYLDKAKVFAAIMMDPTFEQFARVPDCPFSLFEGWAGALCFLTDLYQPDLSQFPMVPISF